MTRKFAHAALLTVSLASLAAVAACGGGGGGGGSNVPASASGTRGTASITITIPSTTAASSASSRAPAFVSPNAQSVSIVVTAGNASPSPATVANLTSTSPNCTPATATVPLTCTVTLNPPTGDDDFLVTLYQGLNATGSVLSTATVSANVNSSGSTVIPVALGGVVTSIAVSITKGINLIPGGYATSLPVIVAAKDPSGATIVGPGNYSVPIALTNADTSGITTLSTTTVTSPSTAVMLNYAPTNANDGVLAVSGLPAGATTIGASAAGISTSAITPGTFQYINDRFEGFGHTRTLTGTGTATTTTFNTAGVQTGSTTTTYPTITEAVTETLPTGPNFNGVAYPQTELLYTFTQLGGNVETQDVLDFRAYTLNATGAVLYLYGKTIRDTYTGAGNASPITGANLGISTQGTAWLLTNPWQHDALPHTSAGAAWSNNFVPQTTVFSGSDGVFKINADGSYSFVETTPVALTQVASTTGAASNNLVGNFNGIPADIGTITVSPPTVSGIPLALQPTNPPGSLSNVVVPNFYPGGVPTSPLYVATATSTLATIPPACQVPSSLGTQAFAVASVANDLRIATFQYIQELRTDYFIPGIGGVCESYSETNTSYHVSTGAMDVLTVISYILGLNNSTAGLSIHRLH